MQVKLLGNMTGRCEHLSDPSIGWAIREIEQVNGHSSVTLNDGVPFSSDCFAGARVGDIYAVYHEGGDFCGCFGRIRRAILLEPAR